MKVTIKNLHGGVTIVDVTNKMTILELKQHIEKDFNLPATQQTLILLGKSLQDDKLIEDYPKIIDGSKLYVTNKKTEPLNLVLLRFLQKYFSEDQSKRIVGAFMADFTSKAKSLSLDDLERIAKSEIQGQIIV